MSKLGNLFIVAAPSGTGKTTLVNALMEKVDDLKISISYTTRSPRPGDQEGIDYFFIDESKFKQMEKEDAFLEHAEVYGYHYGTGKEWVTQQLNAGIDVLLEIDWQGAQQIRRLFPPALSILILPPSIKALHERLLKRQQDDPAVVEERLAMAKAELEHYKEFNYLVVNDDFNQALGELMCIVCAERLQLDVQQQVLADLLEELLQKQ
ncbi:guanylate kinase [Candidiatus Paracoxiella cheracis]|uniref:guanylate kinase n=1 Tax=Candidiatus Paracoxiella cheracis TaxID=3405120 RepID=UPI003BF5874B